MTDPTLEFLTAIAQSLAALALYPDGHPARERQLDLAFRRLEELLTEEPNPSFSFLGDEVLFGNRPIREMRGWEWGQRLASVGIQRLQFEPTATREDLEAFLDEALARLTLRVIDTSEARQTRATGIRFGAVGVRGLDDTPESVPTATISFRLDEEAAAVQWMHRQVSGGGALPLIEAEAVVRSLAVAMHGDQRIMMPLVQLRRFDEYTTTHSLNVCVLAMALAEWVGMGARDVRAFGIGGLLHDLGKVRVPLEILNKAGKLTDEERGIMNRHPVEGARLILASEPDLNLAAVVAYEHHVMLNGGGYPTFAHPRDCHEASKLIHVCDVYDALRTNRPYRDAWPADKVLAYLEERSGTEFDGRLAHAFTRMMREWEPNFAAYEAEHGAATAD